MENRETNRRSTSAVPRRAERFGALLLLAGLSLSLFAVGACAPDVYGEIHTTEATATVIDTAPPVPPPPLSLEPTVAPVKAGYRLTFHDEFIGKSVDRRKWTPSLPWGNTNAQEQQYYTPQALDQAGGVLTLTARKEYTNGKPYSSGVISSRNSYLFKYGFAEIRAQIPPGDGMWSAFWILSPIPGSNEEVDILEVLGSDPKKGYAVLHYGTIANKQRLLGTYRNPDFSAGLHTFAVDWQPGHMIWYVDGVKRYSVTKHVPSTPMYVVANLSVGGQTSWSGPPNRYTQFPAQYTIDYIRVYQR